jgi:formylmethanofuran dehydrogenase subunit E
MEKDYSERYVCMEYSEIVRFHGHSCPGSAIGYRMTLAAMKLLGVTRSGDEELVAIVENDACGVDALQYLSGCTFGKGNLIFRDYGKPVYTLFSRTSGKGVRVLFLDSALPEEVKSDRSKKLDYILSAPDDAIISARTVSIDEPKLAKIYHTVNCDLCHESVMETRLKPVRGRMLCIPCAIESACE